MTDSQFDALLGALDRLTRAVDSIGKIVAEGTNEVHSDLQDLVSSIDSMANVIDMAVSEDED